MSEERRSEERSRERREGEWIGERNDGGHEEKLGRFPAIGREGS